MANFLTITVFISELRQSLEFLSHVVSWNYFYLVFYKRNKSRSVSDKQWDMRLSTPLQSMHTIRIWRARPAGALQVPATEQTMRGLPLWSVAWAWEGPTVHIHAININWAPLCSWYGMRCWACKEHRVPALRSLPSGGRRTRPGKCNDERMCPVSSESTRSSA